MIRKVKLENDINLEYRDEGEGDVVLLLHGLGSTKADWDQQIESLSGYFRVIAPDLRGHGNSSKPQKAREYGVDLCAEDMKLFLHSLNIDSCNIVGFSMGGAIAFEMAVNFPSLLNKMVIINTAPDFNNLGWFGRKMVIERTIRLKLLGMEHMAARVSAGMFPEPKQGNLRKSFYNRARANDPKAYYHSFRTLMRWGIGERIREIKTPALVVASDMDYTPVALKADYAAKMADAEVTVVRDSRHGITMDQPKQLNKILLNFLRDE